MFRRLFPSLTDQEAHVRNLAETRLATYGTLAPGRANHHQLAGLEGDWRTGTVRGRLREEGWAAELGYPGLVLDQEGVELEVQLFQSADLPEHWSRLDAFEGEGYRRVVTSVRTAEGEVDACVYVLASPGVASEDRIMSGPSAPDRGE
jgi:gamma-glutamylcyclotransferase (GGCT)/AIG2-like uncharacterized protein YtfP